MIHHYELGLLPHDDREEFELHLLECEHCFNSVQRFLKVSEHIRQSPGVRDAVGEISGDPSEPAGAAIGQKARPVAEERRRSRYIPAIAFAAVVVALLILQPWKLEFEATKQAVADENRVAIMYFDNLVDPDDPQKLGEIITNLLITDLSESQYRVVSSQRLYDLVKLLGEEGAKTVDRNLASRIAEEAGATWMLMGKILQVTPELVVTSQLVEVSTGDVIASQRVSGKPGESVFSVADKLTTEARHDLILPAGLQSVQDMDVAEVTTHSPEAYRLYLNGVDSYRKYYLSDAARYFEEALTFDSTLAMAYYYLAKLKDGALISEAMKYSYKASTTERGYIFSLAALTAGDKEKASAELLELTKSYPDEKTAFYLLGSYSKGSGDFEAAIGYLNDAIRIDPLYKEAYNQLAYVYSAMGEFEKSIEAIDKYIFLAPDEANPYDSRGDICALNGRLEQAIESYEKALEVRPDYRYSRQKIAHMYLFNGDYAQADSCYRELIASASEPARLRSRFNLALIPIRQGRFRQALHVLDSVMTPGEKYYTSEPRLRALILEGMNDSVQALSMLRDALLDDSLIQIQGDIAVRSIHCRLLARYGDFAGAESASKDLTRRLREADIPLITHWYTVGTIEFYRGNFEAAIQALEKSNDDTERKPCFAVPYMLARAYQESGRLEDAVAIFEKELSDYNYWRLYWGVWNVEAHYYLGLAYEGLGLHDKAIEQYGTFLDIWQNADSGIASLDDARKRLARLESVP